jgi:hypothetical protein
MAIRGSCLCGSVRYEVTQDPLWAHNCHCSRCRKTRGAPFATNLFVPLDGLRFTQGEDQVRSYKPPEAARFTHAFCGLCGSTLPWRDVVRGLANVPMGSLDDDPGVRARANIFVASKAPWFTITDDLPQHPERP